MKKKIIIGILLILTAVAFYYYALKPTKILFINYKDFQFVNILNSEIDSNIKLTSKTIKDLKNLKDYDFIILRAHGLTLSKQAKQAVKEAGDSGIGVLVTSSTSPENDITTIGGRDREILEKYIDNGGSQNYTMMFRYIRKNICNKVLWGKTIKDPIKVPYNYLFYPNVSKYFLTVKEYLDFYKQEGKYKEKAKKIAIFASNLGSANGSDQISLIVKFLEEQGVNVFVVSGFSKRFQYLKEINPDLAIYLPHGSFALQKKDELIKYLKSKGTPLLCPINVFEPYEKWVKKQMGVVGGMLGQSIVVPEFDGGIEPIAISAQFKNKQGLYVFKGIERRCRKLANRAVAWLKLKSLDNSQKKVAVYYYKGPGKNAMTASGLEVSPSLYNLLKYLKNEGYNTGELPENEKDFYKLIQAKGSIYGNYAKGNIDKYLKSGAAELIAADEYDSWLKETLEKPVYKSLIDQHGKVPGKYMVLNKNNKDYIAVTRIKFGNITILPQPMPGAGKDENKLVHGVKMAPPHTYVASYLWCSKKFKANVIMHFGTHGSLEFTPYKQTALSDYDWPDILIGELPHIYLYTISNIGEAMIAKRRSYATISSHITPPFKESSIYGDLSKLEVKVRDYESISDPSVKNVYKKNVAKLIKKLNLTRDLNFKDLNNLSDDDMEKIHNYLHTISHSKINDGLYTLGVPYNQEQIQITAKLMSIDAIANCLAKIAISKNKEKESIFDNKVEFDRKYLSKSEKIVKQILDNQREPLSFIDKDKLIEIEKREKAINSRPTMASMMAQALSANENKKSKKKAKKKYDTAHYLKKLESEDIKFLKTLTNEKKFKRTSKLLDNKYRGMIKMMSKMNKKMAASVAIASKPAVLNVLNLMQDKDNKKKIFAYLSDENFLKSVKEESSKIIKEELSAITQDKVINNLIKNSKDIDSQYSIPQLREIENKVSFLLTHYEKINDKDNYGKENLKLLIKELGRNIEKKQKKYNALMDVYINYKKLLLSVKVNEFKIKQSFINDLESIMDGFNGKYILPSSGGDPIRSPDSVPTGKNLVSIDPNLTPSKEVWEISKKLGDDLIKARLNDTGKYPVKVAFTLWGGEFLRDRGITLGEIFYLMGVKPKWNMLGRVYGVELIEEEDLNRPRIDVVVQTSGQFRDIAPSRIFLINKAVKLAASARSDKFPNYVRENSVQLEADLKSGGISPAKANKYSYLRVFGGVNGNYGTGIMSMVESDKWSNTKEIAKRYINNMGAVYSQDQWGEYIPGLFKGAVKRTDTLIQSRSSNTYGPLSLDHVYEFMGGFNTVIKEVNGNKSPKAYFNDLRDSLNPKIQSLKEAVNIEARAKFFNPSYIKGLISGGASSAEVFAELVRNTYGWSVTKNEVIDPTIWDDINDVYINDKYNLKLRDFFETKNPYALQDITSFMLESNRRGFWKPSKEVIKNIMSLHINLIDKHKASCSGFVCNNKSLRKFIEKNSDEQSAKILKRELDNAKVAKKIFDKKKKEATVLKKEEKKKINSKNVKSLKLLLGIAVFIMLLIIAGKVMRRKK